MKEMNGESKTRRPQPQSQEGDALYEWLVPLCVCKGLAGDHGCGDVGLYTGDAGAMTEISKQNSATEFLLTVGRRCGGEKDQQDENRSI